MKARFLYAGMLPRSAAMLLLGALLPLTGARGDVVETTDGARLTGTIVGIDSGKIKLKTSYAGTLEIDQTLVSGFSSDSPVFVRLESGSTMSGTVTRTDGKGGIAVNSSDGTLTTDITRVTAAWQPSGEDPQLVAARKAAEKLKRRWSYNAAVDISGKTGNSDQSGTAIRFKAALKTDRDELAFTGSYSKAERDGVETANEIKGGASYTNYFQEHFGWYVRGEIENDEFEDLDLRTLVAGGLSYRFFNLERHKLALRAGLSYLYESYEDDSSLEDPTLDLGLDYFNQFAEWGRLSTVVSYQPTFEDLGNFRLTHDSGVEIPLGTSNAWSVRFGINHSYNSDPAPGREELDTSYYTRLLLTWD